MGGPTWGVRRPVIGSSSPLKFNIIHVLNEPWFISYLLSVANIWKIFNFFVIIDMHDTGPNRPSSRMACWNMRCHELYALYLENFGLQHPVFSMALAFYMYGYTRSSLSLVAL